MGIIGFRVGSKEVASKAIGAIIFQFLIRFKGVLILPLIVNYLSSEIIGEWRVLMTCAAVLVPLLTLNILDGSGMFFSSDFEVLSVSKKFNTVVNVSLITLLINLVPLFLVLRWFELTRELALIIVIYVIVAYMQKVSIFLYQVYQRAKKLILLSLIIEYGSAALTLLLLHLGERNLLSIVGPLLFLNLIVSIWALFEVSKEVPVFKIGIDFHFIKKVMRTSIPLLPVFFSEWIVSSVGIFFIGHFHDTNLVGNFSIALSIATLMLTLKATLQYFWFSSCSNLLQNKMMQEFDKLFIGISKSYIILISLGVLFYIFFVNDLITLLSNKSYLNVSQPVIILVIGYAFMILASIYNGILYALGRTKEIMWVSIIASVAVVFGNIILVPNLDIYGASYGILIGGTILFAGNRMLTKKFYRIPVIEGLTTYLFKIILLIFVGIGLTLVLSDITIIRAIGALFILIFLYISYKYNFKITSLIKNK